MKSKVIVLALCFMLLFNSEVFASNGPEVETLVNGTIDKGQTIQILINIKNIQSFFAGAMEFRYDKNILKVKSIELGDLISKADVNKFDAINKIDEQNGIAAYGFSCLGKVNGFSGTGTFVKINAEVLKKDSFHIRSKAFLSQPNNDFNLKLQICDSNIKELEYNFKPYEFNLNGTSGNNGGSNGSNSSTNGNNTGGSTENNNKENLSPSNNTNTSTSASSSQNNTNSNSTSKNTSTEEKSNNSIIKNAISGDKKDDLNKAEARNKTDSTNNNTVDTKKDDTASNSNSSNETKNIKIESKSKAKAGGVIFILLIVSGAAVIGYKIYKGRKSGGIK